MSDTIAHGTNYRYLKLNEAGKQMVLGVQVTIFDPNVNNEITHTIPLEEFKGEAIFKICA